MGTPLLNHYDGYCTRGRSKVCPLCRLLQGQGVQQPRKPHTVQAASGRAASSQQAGPCSLSTGCMPEGGLEEEVPGWVHEMQRVTSRVSHHQALHPKPIIKESGPDRQHQVSTL